MMMLLLAAVSLLVITQQAAAQSSAYGQCGGTGWSGATTCVSGYTCTYSNPYYSQCLPGSSPTTASSSSTVTSTPGGGSTSSPTTTSTSTASTGSATLLPNQLWIRCDEEPDFHMYLQSEVSGTPGDAVLVPPTGAGQFQITSGQLIQFTPSGTELYAGVYPPAANTTRLKVFFGTAPATNVSWVFQGDGVTASITGYTQQSPGSFLLCNDFSATIPNVYVNQGAYDYMTPTGCVDGTLNYYNGATAVS